MPRVARPAPVLAAIGDTPLTALPGCGPKVAATFAARGLATLQDLWWLLPRQYEDRTQLTPVRALQPGVAAQVEGVVEAVERGFRYRPSLRVAIGDDSRATLVLRFFHFRAAQVAQFAPGARLRVFGTPRPGAHGLEMVHPAYRLVDGDEALGERLDPVYPAIEGIGPAMLRRLIAGALDRLPDDAALELLPAAIRDGLALPSLREALLTVHRPAADADVTALLAGRHPAQRRLVLEELLAHHLSLRRQRIALQRHGAHALPDPTFAQRLRDALPFALTAAQQRVLAQVQADLARGVPMLRLVQGDVGSGVLASLTVQGDRRRCLPQLLKGLNPPKRRRAQPLTFMEARRLLFRGVSSFWPAGWHRCTTPWPGLRHGLRRPMAFSPRKASSRSAWQHAG